jgi:hypothetical protein
MSSDDGVASASKEKGGGCMDSDLDGLTCFNLCYHPYLTVGAMRCIAL